MNKSTKLVQKNTCEEDKKVLTWIEIDQGLLCYNVEEGI